MGFALFRSAPLIDDVSARWMSTVFDWALSQFEAPYFHRHTPLVRPDNTHFPGRAASIEEMAANLLRHTLAHAGLSHWPHQLVEVRNLEALPPSPLTPAQARRAEPPTPAAEQLPLVIPYDAAQVNDPQTLVASYATFLGHHLGELATVPAPATVEQQPLVAELVGIYLGFGVLFANSAFAFKGGCGSCRPGFQRTAYLSQDEAVYALALFCRHKQLEAREVLPHLKKHLRPIYKKARKELQRRIEEAH
ncbi:hypothetical protein [Motiliproteus sp. SC1-56]|uniref:hypothetical protein n=1 Tax=Motiliproteus sp. SC1-56 TaxID=2799565 RepID=UPI001A909E1D|nr:hypothetical protein [Motiliproteus sp. SC1-56]